MKRRQSELFPDTSPAPSAKDLRIVRQGSKPLTKEQQAFNRLLARVQSLRSELEEWKAFEERHHQTVLRKLVPLQNELCAVRREMILTCDGILDGRLGGGVSSKAERKRLVAFVLDQCVIHLDVVPADADVLAVHDRHAARGFAETQEEERAADRALAREIFGVDLDDEEASGSFEELLDSARRKAEAAAREASEARESARKSRKAREREEARRAQAEQAAREVGQSIREVYRKLASALHPDRAADETDRVRRHGLMQRVNEAYERSDLLGLLTLQLEIEQIDEDHVGAVSPERLRHYNEVLAQQASELDREVRDVTMRLRATMLSPGYVITPQSLERDLKRCIAEARRDVAALREHAQALLVPDFRRAWLREEEKALRAEAREVAMFDEILDPADVEVFFARGDGVSVRWTDEPSKPRKRRRKKRP